VLYTIQKLLGNIGNIVVNNGSATFTVSGKEDTDKLLEYMYDYFSRLNTTKVLDFLA